MKEKGDRPRGLSPSHRSSGNVSVSRYRLRAKARRTAREIFVKAGSRAMFRSATMLAIARYATRIRHIHQRSCRRAMAIVALERPEKHDL